MGVLIRALVPTLVVGSIYASLAIGYVLLFRTVRILSFAQGAFMVIGATLFSNMVSHNIAVVLALVISVVALGVGGAVVYHVVYGRLAGADPLLVSFSTIGLGIVIETVLYLTSGTSVTTVSILTNWPVITVTNDIRIAPYQWFAVAACVVGLVLTALWLRYTSEGTRARAVADSATLAPYYGINVRRTAGIAWGVAAAWAAIAGIAFALQSSLDPVNMPTVSIAAFPAIILGGIDSILGAVLGGFIIAAIDTVLVAELGGQYETIAGYVILLAMLLLRPNGIFGSPNVSRV
jgi:branched-chain amino acid transport system permease protein